MNLSKFDHIQIASSRLLNSIVFGNCKQMLSTEVHKRNHWLRIIIDSIFFFEKNHCERCAEWENKFNE